MIVPKYQKSILIFAVLFVTAFAFKGSDIYNPSEMTNWEIYEFARLVDKHLWTGFVNGFYANS